MARGILPLPQIIPNLGKESYDINIACPVNELRKCNTLVQKSLFFISLRNLIVQQDRTHA